MTTWITIPLIFVLLILLTRFFTYKMYALKPNKHEDTPEKLGLKFEEVRFSTENNRTLYGWWIPAEKETNQAPTIVLVHGWSRNLGRMLRYIQHLHPLNYNLLAFDARHHGSSDQDDHASMFKFGRDVKASVQYTFSRDINPDRIGVLGLSIGGAGSTYAAAIEPAIKAVVTVGAPAHPVDVMQHEFKKHHIPAFFRWLILKQIEIKIGVKYEHFAPINNIAKADASFLVIHGENDDVVLPSQGDKMNAAARPGQCEYWPISGRGHSDCHHEPGFWERVDKFYKTQFKKG
ncbi:MAG: alpha/beta fold hydrolase [FCB group bacterium]|nr:alpha/beta fold hydrolase [FCB group bacterium]MBL7028458.1 alpha/beta fold hydrolase [Candidatus Neomarinimicrobiota bacterium]MBL7122372.1 alpha/beta fold hydrolase [Candidatus Neomarinimicrobiota bacterium]